MPDRSLAFQPQPPFLLGQRPQPRLHGTLSLALPLFLSLRPWIRKTIGPGNLITERIRPLCVQTAEAPRRKFKPNPNHPPSLRNYDLHHLRLSQMKISDSLLSHATVLTLLTKT